METTKAIKILKNSILHYTLCDQLVSIGLDSSSYTGSSGVLYEIIFDLKYNDDKILDIFCQHCELLTNNHNFNHQVPDEELTSTAINIYSDWKAFSKLSKENIKNAINQ